MNNLNKEQNRPEILKLQFLQRKSYKLAELLNWISWIPVILSILILAISYLIDYQSMIFRTIVAVTSLSTIPLIKYYGTSIQLGADAKSIIDVKLYNVDFITLNESIDSDAIFNTAIKYSHKKDYKTQISNTGKENPPGLLNWYECNETLDKSDAILCCQKSNLWWNKELSNLYLKVIRCVVAFVIILILSFAILMGFSIVEFLIFVVLSFSMLVKFNNERLEYKKYNYHNLNASNLINRIEKYGISNNDLKDLQHEIDSIRRSGFLVPNFFHKLTAKKFHDSLQEQNELEEYSMN